MIQFLYRLLRVRTIDSTRLHSLSTFRVEARKSTSSRAGGALLVLFLLLAPYILLTGAALAQTEPPQQKAGDTLPIGAGDLGAGDDLSPKASRTDPTSKYYTDARADTNLVTQEAEQNKNGVTEIVTDMLKGQLGEYNDVYWGQHQFWSDDIVSNLFSNIGQLIGKWLTEFIDGWVADTVQFLTAFLRIFVLNPNIAVNGLNGNGQDDISPYIRQAADIMYGVAVDLLLLLFVLCIWKYWAEASWRGGGNLMGAVGRLIFTAGLMLAWPTIYAFEIQITNEMIKAIYFNSADQVVMLDAAMAAAVKGGLMATAGGLAHAFAPVIFSVAGGALGGGAGGLVLGTVGDIVSFAGLLIYTTLGVVLITELVYFLVLKAIQTALLVAQYMFAPIFLVFFATPDTESVTSGFVKAFVEVSLWNFVWIGLLKIMVIVLYSDFNPWGKIIMAVGILQIMIQVPGFLSRAQISPMSDFISAGLISGSVLNGFKALGMAATKRTSQLFDYMFNQQYAARGLTQSTGVEMATLPTQAADPKLLNQIRAAAVGKSLDGRPDTGPGRPPAARGDGANALAAPGLTGLNGQQPETEQQKQARLEQERQQKAQQYAAVLAAARTGTGLPGGTQPVAGAAGVPLDAAGANLNATPGVRNNLAAGALVGASAGMARALSDAGLHRGVTDPTTTNVAHGLQGAGQAFEKGLDDKFTHGGAEGDVINPAQRFNHAGYKFVQAKIAAVDARTYNGNSIGFSDDGQNKLVGDGRGNLRHMRARKGASAEEVAHLVLAGGFTELFKDDSEAFDAARQSAIDSGEDGPKGMFERMGAGFMAHQGGTFKQTARAKERFAKSLFKHAALGAESYVSGKPGNAYTEYLRTRFGDWSAKDDTWGTHILTDAASPESPWNPKYVPATETVFQSGLPINNQNRAAAANPYVMKLPAWQRRAGIVAVSGYLKQLADAQYPDADDYVRDAAIGRMSQQVGNSEVEAAYAIQVESNGADVSVPIVQTVAQLREDPRCKDAASAYLNLRSLVAHSSGGGTRRGNLTIQAMLRDSGGGGGSAAPVHPGNVHIPTINSPPPVVQQDADIEIVGGGGGSADGNQPVQRLSMDVPLNNSGQPQVHTDTRVHGGGGAGGGGGVLNQNVEVEVRGVGGQGQGPTISQGEIAGAVAGAGVNTRPLYMAAQMMLDMYNAGFNDSQIQDPKVANIATHYYSQGQPHMLSTVAVAARVLGNNDVSAGTVQTIQTMIDAGHNPNQIQRPDVWTAEACIARQLYPTPAQVRRWRLDERFSPHRGSMLPPNLGRNDGRPDPPQHRG